MKNALDDAKKNKNIIFKQNLDDKSLVYEYNISTLFIFPSFYEGFGLPPLEAMACGTPVVTSSVSSLPEVCGNAVSYCDPYNTKDILKKMEFILNDIPLQNEMIAKGLQRSKSFTWKKSAEKHIEVFLKLL
jgi:glycosyltransferase involved in cell wall biosynthesis